MRKVLPAGCSDNYPDRGTMKGDSELAAGLPQSMGTLGWVELGERWAVSQARERAGRGYGLRN